MLDVFYANAESSSTREYVPLFLAHMSHQSGKEHRPPAVPWCLWPKVRRLAPSVLPDEFPDRSECSSHSQQCSALRFAEKGLRGRGSAHLPLGSTTAACDVCQLLQSRRSPRAKHHFTGSNLLRIEIHDSTTGRKEVSDCSAAPFAVLDCTDRLSHRLHWM